MPRAALLDWLDSPSQRGIRFAQPFGDWHFHSYEELAGASRRVAWGLLEAGVGEGEIVAVALRGGPEFVAALFGTMLAGAVPAPVAPPAAFHDAAVYREHVARILATAQPSLAIAEDDVAPVFGGRARSLTALVGDVDETEATPRRRRAELALVQFTSGSSGHARGVRVPFGALEANVEAIRSWLAMTPEDATASWLPVHHDMGLIGCLVTPVVNRSDVWLLRPQDFVRSPLRFLRCFGEAGARLTAMPGFALAYLARRVRPDELHGLDFSHWRAVIVGSERLDPDALDRFHRLLAPFGLKRSAILPAYGLAEATLAVTGLPLPEEWRALDVASGTLGLGRKVQPPVDAATSVVGCGRPLGGAEVAILDDEGCPLPEGFVGEIALRGESVGAGYVAGAGSGSSTAFLEDGLRSGDAGFVVDGQLFVLGRLGDSMKLRGLTLFAEDLEVALAGAGIPRNRLAVALGVRDGLPTAVAVLEGAHAHWAPRAYPLLRRLTEGVEVEIAEVPRGTVARTSSGKPKRRQLWEAFLDGRLTADRRPDLAIATTGGAHV